MNRQSLLTRVRNPARLTANEQKAVVYLIDSDDELRSRVEAMTGESLDGAGAGRKVAALAQYAEALALGTELRKLARPPRGDEQR